jgi:quercetin dioxygenase-like cupin family protein
VIYVVEGSVTVTVEGESRTFEVDDAWFGSGSYMLKSGEAATRLWRWELDTNQPADDGLAYGEGVASTLKLVEVIVLDPRGSYLMRCDRVDFPLGGIAYTHIHWGSGTRCLLRGELKVQTGGVEQTVRPGEAWFERGPDPVYAEASKTELTSFIRAMVLPRAIMGQTSIRYIKEEDQDKPKPQQYTRYVDEPFEL